MKIIVGIARTLVGIIFILSGFVKLNDPVGFSYKLQEYFSPGVLNLEFLIPFALVIALAIVIFELLIGVMLLLGYAPKFTRWSLLLMIVFFTFLTFYSAYFNKVTDCGCFGDAVKLTPWESFWKDVTLLVLILIIFFNQNLIRPLFQPKTSHKYIVFAVFIGCLGFGYYVLMHLPVFDFRAYNVGTDIEKAMEIPENAPEALYEYTWTFETNGEEKQIVNHGAYPTVSGKYLGVKTTLIHPGYVPPVHDFSFFKNGVDYVDQYLNKEKLLIIASYNLATSVDKGWEAVAKAVKKAKEKGYTVIGISASSGKAVTDLKSEYGLHFPFYITDATTVKTIVRSSPGLVVLHAGVIVQKCHWNDANELKLN